jgi:hypothetical protein
MVVVAAAVLAGWGTTNSGERWPEGPQRFGVTLWRLRESAPGDEVRIPIEPSARNGLKRMTEFTPVRIGLDQPVPAGSMVQISVESAQDGHLYIIDQELSSAPGKPCLIFPDPRIRAGATRVRAGDVIHLPYLDESVRPYWLLGSTDTDYRGELLTIVMSPRQLDFTAVPGPCREVPSQDFARWRHQWAATYTLDADPTSLGRPVSRGEADAGRGSKALTLDDPRPQVILSMAGRSPKAPVLIWFKVAVNR